MIFVSFFLRFKDWLDGKPTTTDRGEMRSSKWPTARRRHPLV